MDIVSRNLLTIKDDKKLPESERILYEPYKNIVSELFDFAVDARKGSFDPVYRAFVGLESISHELRHYYESLLTITSYFHASKGGRGRYIEKRISSVLSDCVTDVELKSFPEWMMYPEIWHKKGIWGESALSRDEKSLLRNQPWDWTGEKSVKFDLGRFDSSKGLVALLELKNRVDSGGTAARREIWTNKFVPFLDLVTDSSAKLFRREDLAFCLSEFFHEFGVKKIAMYAGILFGLDGLPATVAKDQSAGGFYSSNCEGFQILMARLARKSNVKITARDDVNCHVEFNVHPGALSVAIGTKYGDDVTEALLGQRLSVSNLLGLRYDDIWLSLLTALREREILLREGKNLCTIILKLFEASYDLRKFLDDLIREEGALDKLSGLVQRLTSRRDIDMPWVMASYEDSPEQVLADCILFIACAKS